MVFLDSKIGRFRIVLPAALVLLSLGGMVEPGAQAVKAGTALLEEIRYWYTSEHTRVVLDIDRNVRYEVHRLEEDRAAKAPQRICIDLLKTRCAEGLQGRIKLEKGPVQLIRASDRGNGTGRLVLDVRQMMDFEVFQLDRPDRIVVDIWWNKRDKGREGTQVRGPGSHAAPSTLTLPLVVLDPGHGGHDPGAIGKRGLREKNVALSIAVELDRELTSRKKARVVLTRSKDVFVSLEARTRFANVRNADLFVSIHANASRSRRSQGVETYYLDNTTDRASIRLAALENKTAGKDIGDLQRILTDLRLTANASESNLLARTIQGTLIRSLTGTYKNVNDLGSKGNLFYVLLGAHMPSVLVEVSFISNEMEEKRLRDPKYLKVIVRGIADGIERYCEQGAADRLIAGK